MISIVIFVMFIGEFNLLSDGSSPNTSAGNTPDSGDALDESTDSGVSGPASLPPTLSGSSMISPLSNTSVEKRSVRELAASLTKTKTDKKENGKMNKTQSTVILHDNYLFSLQNARVKFKYALFLFYVTKFDQPCMLSFILPLWLYIF